MKKSIPDNKVIITVSQTGAITNKSHNPNVPEQPEEIAESALACYNEGAAVCHIHARDPLGQNSADVEIFRDIHERIKSLCPIIIQDSTGGGPNLTQEERLHCLDAKPEMASLNMGTLMRISGVYKGLPWSNMPDEIDLYVEEMNKRKIKPEMEIYNHAMLQDVRRIIAAGMVVKPYCVNIVLGMRYQGAEPSDPETLCSIVKQLPEGAIFNSTNIGAPQTRMSTLAMLLGGCVRVGLEDNIYYSKGVLAQSNAQLVARIVRIAREIGKEPATPYEAREYLGISSIASAESHGE